MASVKVQEEKVVTGVTLELSKDEAQTLADILTHIVGPDEGPRGFATDLWNKLNRAGFIGRMFSVDRGVGTDRVFILPRN